jgi:hypothetical protein
MKNETKEDRKQAKLIYHYTHCLSRLRHRYGLEMTMEEYQNLCGLFRRNQVEGTRKDNLGNIEGWVEFKGMWVCLSYMPDAQLIGTVMPCPPPQAAAALGKNAVRDLVEERARQMLKLAMESEKPPKWARSGNWVIQKLIE